MKRNLIHALLGTLIVVAGTLGAESVPAGTIIVVRHAEKIDDSRDPALSAAGQARAQALAEVLADAGLDVAYASQYQRTRLTAEPAAEAAGLEVIVASVEGDIEAWAASFARELIGHHSGETVLVVGHSNTVPPLVAVLCSCEVEPLADSNYDRIYIVQTGGTDARLIRARYGAP